ncbi:MAG: DegQ family serine endoprotease [Pararhizobium sp.]
MASTIGSSRSPRIVLHSVVAALMAFAVGPAAAQGAAVKPTVPPAVGQPAPPTTMPAPQPPVVAQPQGPASVADLANRLLGAVVNIASSQTVGDKGKVSPPQVPQGSPFQDFFDQYFNGKGGDQPGPQTVDSLGSGFVIDPSGIIVTNNHVIEGADDIEVNFSDGATRKAKVLGIDTKTDLAVLKVDAPRPLTAVSFGDSEKMRIGDWVMAIGNPFGLGGSVTIGIISARGRNINAGPYDNFIQTDAAINRGNSGGPLFNMKGEVIGINTAIISPSGGSIGIGFSIPSELAVNVIDQLRKYGKTRRGWLGVRIQPVTDDIAESLKMPQAQGALIAGIVKGGPADNGVLQSGDVIVSFDGKEIRDMRDLPRIVAESPIGKEVDVVVIRKGKRQTVKVKLGQLNDADAAKNDSGENTTAPDSGTTTAPAPTVAKTLGMTLGKLDEAARKKFGIAQDVDGVVVTAVDPDSAASEKHIAAGDVIVEVAQEDVSSPQEVVDQIATLKDDGRRNALLMLADKTGQLRFLTVRMN